jgi:hypothetical protein
MAASGGTTKRISNQTRDKRLMEIREQMVRLKTEVSALQAFPEGSPRRRSAEALEKKLEELRRELNAMMNATIRL